MSELTPRVGLYKPADDGSEPINVATDLNDNLEKLDNSVGFVPSTVATPPASPFDGMASYETDSGRVKLYKNSVWSYILAAGASFLSHVNLGAGYRLGLGVAGTPQAIIDTVVDNVTSFPFIRYKAATEANPRMQLDSDGIRFGPGTAVADTRIYRPAPNQLNIVGGVNLESDLSVGGSSMLADVDISGSVGINGGITTDLFVDGDITSSGIDWSKSVRKLIDTPRLNTAVVADDPEMFINLEANTTYFVELYMIFSGNTTADFKSAWSFPAGATGFKWCLGAAAAMTNRDDTTMRSAIHGFGTEIAYGTFQDGLSSGGLETLIITTTTAGQLRFRFSQATANTANATTLRAGTVLRYRKIA